MRTLVGAAEPEGARPSVSVQAGWTTGNTAIEIVWHGVSGGCGRCPHGIVLHVSMGDGMHCCVCACSPG